MCARGRLFAVLRDIVRDDYVAGGARPGKSLFASDLRRGLFCGVRARPDDNDADDAGDGGFRALRHAEKRKRWENNLESVGSFETDVNEHDSTMYQRERREDLLDVLELVRNNFRMNLNGHCARAFSLSSTFAIILTLKLSSSLCLVYLSFSLCLVRIVSLPSSFRPTMFPPSYRRFLLFLQTFLLFLSAL